VVYSFHHQVHGAGRVLKAGVLGTGIDVGRHTQLLDARKSLQVAVLVDFVQEPGRQVDESEDGVVDDFTFGFQAVRF